MKNYKSQDGDQVPTELIQAGGEILVFGIHKFINSIWNKEELPHQLKVSRIILIQERDDKNNCNNYRGISLLSKSFQILSNIPISKLRPYIDEITGDH
jgi:hypothetical protein